MNEESLGWDYQSGQPGKSLLRRSMEFTGEMLKVAVISLAIILPIRYFLIQPFYVKGASMEPNFYDHEYLIIDEITYRFGEPQRGDIVVFRYPNNPSQFFIKRVVALPGEGVKIKDGKVYVQDDGSDYKLLSEPYLDQGTSTHVPINGYDAVQLREDEYFLLGDNRDRSMDSRFFGAVERDLVIGRTWLRGWPFNKLTVFSTPEYDL